MSTRVLVVDDHPLVRKALAEECRWLGCAVATAANGAEALDLLDTFDPDIIVLDLRMPVMDGREFAFHYRRRTHCQAVLVLLSAEDNVERIGQEMGADMCVSKQHPNAFRETMALLLESPQQRECRQDGFKPPAAGSEERSERGSRSG